MTTEEKDSWTQGFVCGVCIMITLEGLVQTQTREMFRAGVGNGSIEDLRKMGVDESDLEVLEAYWKELH